MTATRLRRLAVVGILGLAAFIALNAGYFIRELDFQIARLGASLTGSSVIELKTDPVVTVDAPLGPNELRIASVGIRSPIIDVPIINEERFQDALMHGVVHYPQTARIGQPGNAFIFGHSSDFSWRASPYRHIFSLLPHVVAGDVIEVTDEQGTVYQYRVTETFIVSPTDTRVLDQGDGSQSLLTLQTSYPFGTALARYIVRAELVL